MNTAKTVQGFAPGRQSNNACSSMLPAGTVFARHGQMKAVDEATVSAFFDRAANFGVPDGKVSSALTPTESSSARSTSTPSRTEDTGAQRLIRSAQTSPSVSYCALAACCAPAPQKLHAVSSRRLLLAAAINFGWHAHRFYLVHCRLVHVAPTICVTAAAHAATHAEASNPQPSPPQAPEALTQLALAVQVSIAELVAVFEAETHGDASPLKSWAMAAQGIADG